MKLLPVKPNTLRKLARGITQARIGQDKSGCSLSTQEILKFNLDHALARDAIHTPWNYKKMMDDCIQNNIETCFLRTNASTRKDYLLNPTLGTRINPEDENIFHTKFSKEINKDYDVVITVTDGLSAFAVEQHFCIFLNQFYSRLKSKRLTSAPIVFAPYGRVALSDHIGVLFSAKISVIFVGERPGLSAADSMGIYLTYDPQFGRQNADRNCISNIRPPFGLSYEDASNQLCDLIDKALTAGFSGGNLKLG